MYIIHTTWLLERNPNYPTNPFGAAKRPPKGMLPSLVSFRQPLCMYCIYFVSIVYVFRYICLASYATM